MDKVDAFLQEQMSAEELAEELTDKLLAYGGKLSLAQLVTFVGGPEGPLHKIVQGFLRDNGLKYCRSRLPEQLNGLLDQPVGRWLPEGLVKRYGPSWETQAARYLAEGLKSDVFQQSAAQAVRRLAEAFCTQPLRESLAGYDQAQDRWAAKGQQIMETYVQRLSLPIERWIQQLENVQTFEKIMAQGDRYVPILTQKLSARWRQKPVEMLYGSVFTEQWVEEILPVCRHFISDKLVEAAAGNLSQLAENSLNSLSNDEILQLVEDFMGRELKPLNYLGAVLGALVGVVTGAVVAGPVGALTAGQTASMAAVAAGRSAVYGAVGYGTNCAAIKGLFWPYKPVAGVRALQGVVPKQQERFANSLGQMVNRYVLNEDILQEILVGQHERWQAMGTALAANPVVAADILGQITQQREKIQQGSYEGLLHKSRQYLPRGLEKLASRPLKEILPLEHLALSVDAKRLSQRLTRKAAVFCRSEQKLDRWVKAGTLMAPVGTFIKEQVPKLWAADFKQPSEWYASWLDRPLADVLPQQWPSAAQDWLSGQMSSLGQREALVNYLTELVNGFLSEQTLGEAFGGQLSRWLMDNITSILQLVLNEIIGWLAAKEEAITHLVQEQIRAQLSLMQLVGYAAVGGDELVGQIVERLVTIKLPIFLAVRQQEIGQAIENYWQSHLAPLSPAELALQVTPEAMAAFLERLGKQPRLHQEMAGFLADAELIMGRAPLAQWLAPTVLKNMQTLTSALSKEMALMHHWLDARWQREQDEILFQAARLLEPFIQKQLERMTIGELLGPCTQALERLDWEKLLALGDFEPLAKTALSGVLTRVAEQPLESWLDWPRLEAALAEQLEGILASTSFQVWWNEIIAARLQDAPRLWEEVLPVSLREELTSWVVQAFLASLQQEGSAVLKEMNLAQVTSVQVQAMDAQQLEQLVHGFAQPYFKHIQNMGWLGAGFAIPGILLSYWLL